MKANEIVGVLEKLGQSSYNRVLIDGEWGIGKTKYVEDFTKLYSNSCYISLFGQKDIKSIIQEIYFKLIANDDINSKFKKGYRIVAEKLDKIDFSISGFSLSVPLLGDIYNVMEKELDQKDTYIIIFDDLERKHEQLGLKEIFGLLDSLAKIKGIKTVLIAATKQFDTKNKRVFYDYKEKAIDRTYFIERYSDNAPAEILGEEVWRTLKSLTEFVAFKNLRTFQKINLFIAEVINTLGSDVFSEKFTKKDVYRMCFATIVFNIEHNNEMVLINEEMRKYSESESSIVDYLCVYVLKNSLDNAMSKSVLFHIKRWYETGEYDKTNILNEIDLINNFNDKPRNFFSSEEEMVNFIIESKKFLEELTGEETISNIIQVISNGVTWSEALSVKFGLEKEEILRMIKPNIAKHVDIEKNMFENDISISQYALQNQQVKDIIHLINDAVTYEYYNKLTEKIIDNYTQGVFNNYYLHSLMESIINIKHEEIRKNLKKKIEDNHFFFPLPTGQITSEHWDWCILCKILIFNMNKHWGIEGYFDNFVRFVKNEADNFKDRMLQHRIKILFEGNE
ncbi:KAP family NTPase [Bacillus spizizenii]|nr:KAP family NTPase [Bacillus spizizenii]